MFYEQKGGSSSRSNLPCWSTWRLRSEQGIRAVPVRGIGLGQGVVGKLMVRKLPKGKSCDPGSAV